MCKYSLRISHIAYADQKTSEPTDFVRYCRSPHTEGTDKRIKVLQYTLHFIALRNDSYQVHTFHVRAIKEYLQLYFIQVHLLVALRVLSHDINY